MTVSNVPNNVSYVGDGVTTSFPFTFRCDDPSWATVNFTDDISGVSINVDQDGNPGGSVIYNVAPPLNQQIDIIRFTPLDQLLNYTRYGAFDSESTEDVLDKIVMMIQDRATEIQEGQTSILQIQSAVDGLWAFKEVTGSRDFELSDFAKMLLVTPTVGTVQLTMQPNVDVPFNIGTQISIHRTGGAAVQWVPGPGVTIESPYTDLIAVTKGTVTLIQRDIDVWFATGNIQP